MKKMTISIPDNIFKQIDQLKIFYSGDSISSILSLGIETLTWIKEQQEKNFTIIAEKTCDHTIIIRELPFELKNCIYQK